MKNVQMKVEKNKLTITVDITQDHGLTSSGKNVTIASTGGNQSVPGHDHIKIGLNVYKKAE